MKKTTSKHSQYNAMDIMGLASDTSIIEALNSLDKFVNGGNYITNETDEEKVVRLVKGDFEKHHGITVDSFFKIYSRILKDEPERLI